MYLRLKKGFTLIELLVVISIIALLMSILMPALRRVREQAKQRVCANNIHQHLLSLTMYASENDDNLPLSKLGWWLWDLDNETVDFIIKSGAVRGTFYCPSNRNQKLWADEVWDFAEGEYRVTGYFWMMENQNMVLFWEQPEGSGHKRWLKKITVRRAGDTELVTDVIISNEEDYGSPEYPDGNFARCMGGMWAMYGVYDSTSHLRTESEPAGGNMGFVDGHVDWRPFKEIERRSPDGVYPTHWW